MHFASRKGMVNTMKKLSVLFIVLLLVLLLAACGNAQKGGADQQNAPSSVAVTREKALETALNKAGLTEAEVRDLDIELDTERGQAVWEIDFEHKGVEYSYDVDTKTGNITAVERERDD